MKREEVCNTIINLKMELYYEMMAEGAWCGHMYAAEYLQDFRTRIIKLCEDIKEMDSIDFRVKDEATSIAWRLDTDYNALITKVYKLDWVSDNGSRQDIYDIADSLNESFKYQLEKAVEDLSYIYKMFCNQDLDEDIVRRVYGEDTVQN